LVEQRPQRLLDALLAAGSGQLGRRGPRDDDEVVPAGSLACERPERLPKEALHSVALHGTADLPTDRDTESWRPPVGARKYVDHEVAAGLRAALSVHAFELAAPGEPPALAAAASSLRALAITATLGGKGGHA
jgi:hypothetical protein